MGDQSQMGFEICFGKTLHSNSLKFAKTYNLI